MVEPERESVEEPEPIQQNLGMVQPLSASELIRLRLRDELEAQKISQRALAKRLTKATRTRWLQGRIGKLMKGRLRLLVDDAAAIAEVLGMPLSELVRDRGKEFYAEMTPSEVKLFERLRRRPDFLNAVFILVGLGSITENVPPVSKRRKPGRPKNSEPRPLTDIDVD